MASYPYYHTAGNTNKTADSGRSSRSSGAVQRTVGSQDNKSMNSVDSVSVIADLDSPVYKSEIGHDEIEIHLNREEILKGLIYSELLAKPKSKRTGR